MNDDFEPPFQLREHLRQREMLRRLRTSFRKRGSAFKFRSGMRPGRNRNRKKPTAFPRFKMWLYIQRLPPQPPTCDPTEHDWDNEGINPEACLKCGMSLIRHAFTECP